MKRLLSVCLAVIMLLTVSGSFSVSALTDLMPISHDDLPLLNAIANVQAVSGDQAITVVEGDNAPGIVFVNAGEVPDMTAFLTACVDNKVIPVVNITDASQTATVLDARDKAACLDMAVTSPNAAILGNVRRKKVNIRTGLVCDLTAATLTSEEAHAIRTEVRGAPATFCILQCDDASYQVVSELQELAVSVWVQVDGSAGFETNALRAVTSGANGIITDDAAALTDVINTYLADNTMSRTPVLIGHRGNPTQAPENSLSGFITAYENGADIFEIDVEITKDGEIIIMHDDTITRTTDYEGSATVGQMTLAEIKSYRLLGLDGEVTDETVPTLKEVLEEFRDKDCRIFVEFKGYNVKNVTKTAQIIKEYGMEHRVDVISFNTNLIKQTQTDMPGMSTGYLHSASGVANSYAAAIIALDGSIQKSQQCQSSINPNKSIFTTHFMQAATDRGVTVWPWTFTAGGSDKAFLTCPDGLTTDDAQWATNMAKNLEASVSTPIIKAGTTAELTVSSVTYGGDITVLDAQDLILQVIDGEECISLDGTAVTAVADGTATVLCGYKALTTDGSEYVLYAQPVTVTVGEPPADAPADEDGTDMTMWLVIGVGIIGIGVIVGVLVFFKPKKKV